MRFATIYNLDFRVLMRVCTGNYCKIPYKESSNRLGGWVSGVETARGARGALVRALRIIYIQDFMF